MYVFFFIYRKLLTIQTSSTKIQVSRYGWKAGITHLGWNHSLLYWTQRWNLFIIKLLVCTQVTISLFSFFWMKLFIFVLEEVLNSLVQLPILLDFCQEYTQGNIYQILSCDTINYISKGICSFWAFSFLRNPLCIIGKQYLV